VICDARHVTCDVCCFCYTTDNHDGNSDEDNYNDHDAMVIRRKFTKLLIFCIFVLSYSGLVRGFSHMFQLWV
jgi:hypothetical protein